MDGPRDESRGEPAGRYGELKAESREALANASNTLRSVRDRYRVAYVAELARWEALRDGLDALDALDALEHAPGAANPPTEGENGRDAPSGTALEDLASTTADASAAGAAASEQPARQVRADMEQARGELGRREAELARLELAIRNLESTWLFMEQGDSSLVTDARLPRLSTELQMRILEAQEAERVRLAQEVHDGPAQALSNAIFQVEFIDSVFETDPVLARTELRFLRDLLRRELGDVRSFIVRLRPPVLVELGLDGSIREMVATQAALAGLHITADLSAPAAGLSDTAQTVALRVVQEALQNVRKHAGATNVVVATMLDDGQWVLEVRDDGRGFDPEEVATRGRRSFGLQFMRERAELVGARFDVRSGPNAGTVVRLAIPVTRKENG